MKINLSIMLSYLILNVLALGSNAEANIKKGAYVIYSTLEDTTSTGENKKAGLMKNEVLEDYPAEGKFLNVTTDPASGKEYSRSKRISYSSLDLEETLTKCVENGYKREIITVKAGTFDTCKIEFTNSAGVHAIQWIGSLGDNPYFMIKEIDSPLYSGGIGVYELLEYSK